MLLKKLADKLQQQTKSNITHQVQGDFKPSNTSEIEIGMKVEHQKFGFGIVQSIEGAANNPIASINFGAAHGEKKIMLNYAKLRIVN
jgi:DNA helicase-2/ATP-dependent DNA helicase PcrA